MATDTFVGINWGSSAFRAYRIGLDGALLDERMAPRGVALLDRAGMVATLADSLTGWGDACALYASGMIGSNVGWTSVPYLDCPASPADLATALTPVRIGAHDVAIVPGLTCVGTDGAPDILRGEEIELFGALTHVGAGPARGLFVLPGTHTKWVRVEDGRTVDFMTAMSGEVFDRLTGAGLLASVVTRPAVAGPAFDQGVQEGLRGEPGLMVGLFRVRARVIREQLAAADAASYLRGLLIGSELRDAHRLYPDSADAPIPLIGNAELCKLYARALALIGRTAEQIDARDACVAGFAALHRAAV